MRPKQRGIGKLEFLLLVAMFGGMASLLLDRLTGLEEEGERTEVNLTIRNMRVGLTLAVGEHLIRGQEDRLGELLSTNPVGFLGRLPRGYSEQDGDAPGTWHFDARSHTLLYRPRQTAAFGGQQVLRWHMTAKDTAGGRIVGIRLENLPNP